MKFYIIIILILLFSILGSIKKKKEEKKEHLFPLIIAAIAGAGIADAVEGKSFGTTLAGGASGIVNVITQNDKKCSAAAEVKKKYEESTKISLSTFWNPMIYFTIIKTFIKDLIFKIQNAFNPIMKGASNIGESCPTGFATDCKGGIGPEITGGRGVLCCNNICTKNADSYK